MTSVILAACGILGLPSSAAKACADAARGYSGMVAGSCDTTVGAIRSLEPLVAERARWPDLPPDHPAVLCYIDAAHRPTPRQLAMWVARPADDRHPLTNGKRRAIDGIGWREW